MQFARPRCGSARAVNYVAAGTVEFLVDSETGKFYFIEVNPRIQVEHTVTEVVTGVDIVKCQILVSQGLPLDHPDIGLGSQADIHTQGYAIQCRVTTEDAENRFLPDYGRIVHYRSTGGTGVRLDAGTAFSGAVVTPFYDSLLVKVIASGRRFVDAARRMERALQEFRIRGVKTNIPFLLNLITNPKFIAGGFTTQVHRRNARAVPVQGPSRSGHQAVQLHGRRDRQRASVGQAQAGRGPPDPCPGALGRFAPARCPPARRQKLAGTGTEGLFQVDPGAKAAAADRHHVSRRPSIAAGHARAHATTCCKSPMLTRGSIPQMFSIEMWGGATFDTAMRFLKECPWERLTELREKIPNILFQMLLRSSNALGYANYPDNLVKTFVQESAAAGMDIFRIFDSLNWVPNMRVAMDAVLDTNAICEAAICYTGDILDKSRTKYDLKYYVEMAKELEKMGAHILAIKDMAGLCKPYAAELLVKTLKQEIGIPIHFHTHDTSGVQAAAVLKASEANVDIADAAMSSMSGMTSQPNLNSLVEALRFTPRDTGLSFEHLQSMALYWEAVRQFYSPFETGMMASTADVYYNEIPGGQYTNLYEQAKAVGLAARWPEICKIYAEVNQHVRRHRQGHAVVEGRRRHGHVHDQQQSDRRRRARIEARVGLSRSRSST